MLLKYKKSLLYSFSLFFGLILTLFAVNKDNSDANKFELTIGFGLPHACADTPYVPPRTSGSSGSSSNYSGDDDDSGDDSSDGDDDGDSC